MAYSAPIERLGVLTNLLDSKKRLSHFGDSLFLMCCVIYGLRSERALANATVPIQNCSSETLNLTSLSL